MAGVVDAGLFPEVRDPGARVRKVVEYACQVEVDMAIPPKRYFRSGLEMLRMAKVYHEEGNMESAFVLYMKFISLFVEKLPSHPDYKAAPQPDVSTMRKKVKQVFPVAEEIKSKLVKRYTHVENHRKEIERKEAEELERKDEQKRLEEEQKIRKLEEEQERYRSESESKWLHEQEMRLQELKQQELMRNINPDSRISGANNSDQSSLNNQKPSAPSGNLAIIRNDLNDGSGTKIEKNLLNDPSQQPYSNIPQVPDRELKKNLVISDGVPSVDRNSKPIDHFTSIGVTGTNKGGLRDVFIPTDLVHKFLVSANSNTTRNVETCGILAGKLSKNAFYISHVLIPKQSGTSDSCEAEDDMEILMYQDPRDLITLGWIHTHPSQTAFLSSVDMHNQYGYQAMLPEAIAIVCAPKYNETGFFTLSQDRGMKEIGGCRKRGFHEHSKSPPLFENCSHISVLNEMRVENIDLR